MGPYLELRDAGFFRSYSRERTLSLAQARFGPTPRYTVEQMNERGELVVDGLRFKAIPEGHSYGYTPDTQEKNNATS